MKISVSQTKDELGRLAAKEGAEKLRASLAKRGEANIIVATGASQFEMLQCLLQEEGIDWTQVTAFHLDEYVGMPITHPASFRLYLWKRFVSLLPVPLKAFHYINGESDPEAECDRLGALIAQRPIDVAFVGFGENGHLAFNDPPADFETTVPYLVVSLDDDCRRQQLGEGWFDTFDDVPTQAISMSIQQIMAARSIIATVPDARKVKGVQRCLEGPVDPMAPSSILQQHSDASVYLDGESSALLTRLVS
jgi:glucosamine-6-phosphate deaminase